MRGPRASAPWLLLGPGFRRGDGDVSKVSFFSVLSVSQWFIFLTQRLDATCDSPPAFAGAAEMFQPLRNSV